SLCTSPTGWQTYMVVAKHISSAFLMDPTLGTIPHLLLSLWKETTLQTYLLEWQRIPFLKGM
ncbi:MAG: hypothetical protein AAFR66_09410, partial [Bacteroidota bacterium]